MGALSFVNADWIAFLQIVHCGRLLEQRIIMEVWTIMGSGFLRDDTLAPSKYPWTMHRPPDKARTRDRI
jgi:hypothetical protein